MNKNNGPKDQEIPGVLHISRMLLCFLILTSLIKEPVEGEGEGELTASTLVYIYF